MKKKAKPEVIINDDRLSAHEKECAIRYANIQQRLDEGSARFERLEKMMWAVYPFILACLAVAKYT
tara:strand:+ start:733 stop:930 length:198 start_codon:yes stop_codon:yes gene_type:complete